MKSSEQKCPRCECLQLFGLIKREQEGKTEYYIQCEYCRWFKLIISEDSDKIHDKKELIKLKERAKKEFGLYKVIQRKLDKRNGKSLA